MEINNNIGVITKIFANTIEEVAIEQINKLSNSPVYNSNKIRIMPDVHKGNGCTIGTTIKLDDKVSPSLVGSDIGCGMLVCHILKKDIDLKKLDKVINDHIPCGRNIHYWAMNTDYREANLEELLCYGEFDIDVAMRSIGTLGGGNHFIEVDRDEDGENYLVIHSGSRNLGARVSKYYQEMAIKRCKEIKEIELRNIINNLKDQGRDKEISNELKNIPNNCVDKDLAFIDGSYMQCYMHDMNIVTNYARRNRTSIAAAIQTCMDFSFGECFETLHNYIDNDTNILRKGAVRANKGEKLIIPMNMRDGSLICIGKGNEDWNYSAPHGAGRLMSRTEANRKLSMDEYKIQMNGISSTSICENTLDESPMAYKPMKEIINCIGDTVEVEKIIKPIYNFKAK